MPTTYRSRGDIGKARLAEARAKATGSSVRTKPPTNGGGISVREETIRQTAIREGVDLGVAADMVRADERSGANRYASQPSLPTEAIIPTDVTTSEVADTTSLQGRLLEEHQRVSVAGLERARVAGLSALEGEEGTITPAFAGARRQTRAASERGAQRFGEFLARRGLTRGGGAALGETQRLGAQQAALGGLAQQETAAIGDIARRRAGIEAGFASDVEASRAGLAAQQLQQQLAQQQAAPGIAAAQQQQDFENALAQARITGQLGGAQTLASAEFNEGVRQFDANLDFKTKQFEANNALDIRQQSFNEIQDKINTGIRQGQLTVSQGNALLAKKKFEAENDPTSLAFTQRQEALGLGAEPITTTGFKTSPDFAEDFAEIINSTPEGKIELEQFLKRNSQSLIAKYGVDGYQRLIEATGGF